MNKDFPTGAIVNGEVCIERLESFYKFECKGGTLANASEWHDLKRCFQHFAQYAQQTTAPVNAMREALEKIAQAQIGVSDKQEIYDMKQLANKALSSAPAVEPVGATTVSGKEVIERLDKCRKMIGKMCSEGRPPSMEIPAEHNERNEDIYICDTLDMAKEALASPAVEPVEAKMKISQEIKIDIAAGESFTAIQCPNCAQVLDIQPVPPAIEQESAWRDMGSAPKDGIILVCNSNSTWPCRWDHKRENFYEIGKEHQSAIYGATHWQPLPPKPEGEK